MLQERLSPIAPGQLNPDVDVWRQSIDPAILAAATDPASMDPQARQAAVAEATKRSAWGDKIIVSDEKGEPRWGNEITQAGEIFSFNGTIRAPFDQVPDDPVQRNAQGYDRFEDSYLRGTVTHLIVETDDGQQLMIRRRNETRAGDNQEFDIASTGRGSRRSLSSGVLKDVVAIVGEPLVLGEDPQTGKRLRTRGAITKVTTIDMTKEPVAPNHPRLAKPEFKRDTVQRFGEAMRVSRLREVAPGIGESALEMVLETSGLGALPEQSVSDSSNPYERLTDAQLEQVRDNIADSFVDAIRKYDPAEVARVSANLASIQREFQMRFPDLRPEFERGSEDQGVIYVTEPDSNVVERIAERLHAFDGGYGVAAAIYGSLESPYDKEADAKLAGLEEFTLLDRVVKNLRARTGSQFEEVKNPYSLQTNESLAQIKHQLMQTIQSERAQGRDPAAFITNLNLLGEVIKRRA